MEILNAVSTTISTLHESLLSLDISGSCLFPQLSE